MAAETPLSGVDPTRRLLLPPLPLPLPPSSPTPFYLPPPTPHTAHYHSFTAFKDNRWKGLFARILAGLAVIGGLMVCLGSLSRNWL